ncbi:PopZ family protein [Methylorubrum thiocyanatum]|uniref:PopZ family protein n=1 Tax=Methylorubrum thiocyanatum TaxID=47958 RepID=UPI00383B6C67
MSAASPKVQDKTQEPSMEEILASIRRIIADDQAPKPAEVPPAPPAPPPADDDVLDLAEVAEPVRKPEPVAFDLPEIDFRMPEFEPEPEPDFEPPTAAKPDPFDFEPEPEPEPAPKMTQRVRAAVEEEVTERLVSSTTVDSVGQNFQLLAHTVLSQNARTLEDLVKEMLRPMLKSWLDDNLPHMVERLVRSEIERVTRGR